MKVTFKDYRKLNQAIDTSNVFTEIQTAIKDKNTDILNKKYISKQLTPILKSIFKEDVECIGFEYEESNKNMWYNTSTYTTALWLQGPGIITEFKVLNTQTLVKGPNNRYNPLKICILINANEIRICTNDELFNMSLKGMLEYKSKINSEIDKRIKLFNLIK